LATITQWILAYVYGTNIFAILAAIITLAAIIINIAFAISFKRKFNSHVLPVDMDRRVRLGKISYREAWKHRKPIDENFNLFKRQHRCTAYSIFILTTTMNYKFNKAFYTFFYDLKMFQVRFTNTSYYRKMLTTYHIISVICIDLALICVDITCLTMIEDNNQLWVTVVETLILSLLSIILGSIELYMLKQSLEYTETKKNKVKLEGIDSSDSMEEYRNPKFKWDKGKMTERRLLMDDLLKSVKHNRALFLNNKLDELLT
jgi:L-lactate permease